MFPFSAVSNGVKQCGVYHQYYTTFTWTASLTNLKTLRLDATLPTGLWAHILPATKQGMKTMLNLWKQFSNNNNLLFNPSKSKMI